MNSKNIENNEFTIENEKESNKNIENEQEEELNNIFYKLQNYNNILAYSKNEKEINNLLKYVDDEEYIVVNLSISNLLKERFINYYNLKKLPVLISYKTNFYENDENIEETLKLRNENQNIFLDLEIDNFIKKKKIIIFIKGTPDKPECKFTKELIENFDELNLKNGKDYISFNIKNNLKWRERLKIKNDWNTFPQIFIDQLFLGGLDTFKKMKAENIVQKMLFPGEE